MTTLAVTGHMDLTDDTADLVRSALGELIRQYADDTLVGVSCLAEGADSLFAEAVLAADGRLVAVVPSTDYRRRHVPEDRAPLFDRLLDAADEVVLLPYASASQEAFDAANAVLLERADRLVAVWNGEGPSGKGGGTADAVLAAHERGLPVDVVWPEGAARR